METKNKTNKGGGMKIQTFEQWNSLTDNEKVNYQAERQGDTLTLKLTINTDCYSEMSLAEIFVDIQQDLFKKTIKLNNRKNPDEQKIVQVVNSCASIK